MKYIKKINELINLQLINSKVKAKLDVDYILYGTNDGKTPTIDVRALITSNLIEGMFQVVVKKKDIKLLKIDKEINIDQDYLKENEDIIILAIIELFNYSYLLVDLSQPKDFKIDYDFINFNFTVTAKNSELFIKDSFYYQEYPEENITLLDLSYLELWFKFNFHQWSIKSIDLEWKKMWASFKRKPRRNIDYIIDEIVPNDYYYPKYVGSYKVTALPNSRFIIGSFNIQIFAELDFWYIDNFGDKEWSERSKEAVISEIRHVKPDARDGVDYFFDETPNPVNGDIAWTFRTVIPYGEIRFKPFSFTIKN